MEEWPDDLINVEADGNCFYRAIALGLLGSEDVWKDIKKRVIEFIEDHENILFLEFDPDYIREAISYHKVENNWADELIYLMTAHCFNIKLEIENNRYGNSLIYNEECEEAKLFKIRHINENHFAYVIKGDEVSFDNNLQAPIKSFEKNQITAALKKNFNIDFVKYKGHSDIDHYKEVFLFLDQEIVPSRYKNNTCLGVSLWIIIG